MISFFKNIFINKNKDSIYYALDGEVERKLGNYKKSIKLFDIAINIDGSNDMYYISRAIAYKELRKYKEALNDVNKALEINPNIEKAIFLKNELVNLLK